MLKSKTLSENVESRSDESFNNKTPSLYIDQTGGGGILIHFSGDWIVSQSLPSFKGVEKQLSADPKPTRVQFETGRMGIWDSIFLTFLMKVITTGSQHQTEIQPDGLPPEVKRLLALASAVPERIGARLGERKETFLVRVGSKYLDALQSLKNMLGFVGEIFLAFTKLLRGKAQFRRSDLWLVIKQTGADALPIVSLISLLVGLILAFVGAVQLKIFGAQIYVASLVTIAMMRVMGAIMTGIIMAGRTGAAFAAELGTMQVNEEIDALQTLGISPMEFLVLPRVLGLALMMPFLGVYADFMGMLGGLIVGVFMLDISLMQYYNQTVSSASLIHFWIGLTHCAVFGVLIGLAGCLKGLQCGRSAMAVGRVTTSAVVSGIVSIIVATAIITIICNFLGI